MARNANLNTAKNAKKDEFYTQYSDIEAEMNAYVEYDPNVFRGKTILLPCDDPEWSNFTKYFVANFERFGLKKLISTSYVKGAGNRQLTLFELESPLFDESKHETHGKLFTLTRDKDGSGRVDADDIEFSGYLEGDGDFRSAEVTALRDEADIIITNPPFSLFREFLAWIMAGKKQFVILGNLSAITYKELFPLIRDSRVWIGASIHSGDRKFYVPDDYPLNAAGCGIDEDGRRFIRVKGVRWYTNLGIKQRHEELILVKKYAGHEDEYPHYDNYDAINVDKVKDIPYDYMGVMGVPITFLDKYDPEQFEIVAFRKGEDGKDLVFTREREREFNRTLVSLFDGNSGDDKKRRRQDKWEDYLRQNHGQAQIEPIDYFFPSSVKSCAAGSMSGTINGKETYSRILICRKKSGVV